MRRAKIDEQNYFMLRRQHDLRWAADVITDAFMNRDEVQAIAVIGSVSKPLWKEVPRFRDFRNQSINVWHECGALDLAVWLSSFERLGNLRKRLMQSLRQAYEAGRGPSVSNNEIQIFLFEAGTDNHVGFLCNYNSCPKRKIPCMVPGCGEIPFNQIYRDFLPHSDLLEPATHATLYRCGEGRLMSALDLPTVEGQAEVLANPPY